ncbi:hypothetical protein [Leptothrix discophora]|uniref:Histidine kinase n=1 Tax=Leptothrix discophora TaxID=89 RepID=A0ABT9G980_LEPDI|nr:hypothetical protein [Leptothrix discophora]MDP4302996.1 hypothetical protein [Leptothrix discophora]
MPFTLPQLPRLPRLPHLPRLLRAPMTPPACLSAAAVLGLGIGLPVLAGLTLDDGWPKASLVAVTGLGALAMLLCPRRWRGQAASTDAGEGQDTAIGPLIEQAFRRHQAGLCRRGARLLGKVSAAAQDVRLPAGQADLLLQAFDAAVRLLDDPASVEAASAPSPVAMRRKAGPSALICIELDRLDGETGRHARLRLSTGGAGAARCARRLRQLCTRLGAQLDIVHEGPLLRVELVLALPPERATAMR